VTGPGGVGADFSSSLSQDAIEIAQLGEDVVEATPGLGDEPVCAPLAFTNPSAQLVPTPSAGESEEEPAEPTALPDVRGGPVLFMQVELSPRDCEYDPYELAIDIYRQSTSDEFKFVVLVYENDIFEAYVPSLVAIELFDYRNEDKLRAIVDAINRTPDDLRNSEEFPGIVFDTISVQDTNLEALQEMDRRDLDALVVIDPKSRLKGVVSREQVLGSMMLELASRDE